MSWFLPKRGAELWRRDSLATPSVPTTIPPGELLATEAASRPQALVPRVRRALRRRGLRGTLFALLGAVRRRAWLRESHVWYALDLTREPSRRDLEAGLVLRRGTAADLPLLDGLESVSALGAEERISGRNTLWLVFDGRQLVFCCTIYRGRTPVLAADGGWLELPPAVVCLEDSETAAPGRGRGIAPAAWTAIARSLAAEGEQRMITKVSVDNMASRRAVEKIGFTAVALMRFRRIGPLRRTLVEPLDQAHRSEIKLEAVLPRLAA